MSTIGSRPSLIAALAEAEFTRWYWTCAELRAFCRSQGLSSSGVKAALTARVAAHLGGRDAPPMGSRRASPGRLPEPITDATVLPLGQRASRQLREHLERRIGPGFRVDAHVRAFLAADAGATVGELVAQWHATRGRPRVEPAVQFEYNRFAQVWHAAHPGGTAAQCRAAWRAHRALSNDARFDP